MLEYILSKQATSISSNLITKNGISVTFIKHVLVGCSKDLILNGAPSKPYSLLGVSKSILSPVVIDSSQDLQKDSNSLSSFLRAALSLSYSSESSSFLPLFSISSIKAPTSQKNWTSSVFFLPIIIGSWSLKWIAAKIYFSQGWKKAFLILENMISIVSPLLALGVYLKPLVWHYKIPLTFLMW